MAVFFTIVLLWWLALLLAVGLLLVAFARSDCDLTLGFYEKFGKRPSKAFMGKVVWITGASSGIGEQLAYALAACGARLVLSARTDRKLRRVLEKCKELSPDEYKEKHMVLTLNLIDTDHHRDYAVEILQQYGKIDVLVNNAGQSQRAEATQTDLEVDRAVLELNTIGTISLTKSVLPHMIEQRSGTIVIISSVAGKMGAPGSASYSASKHALQGYFDTLRMEVVDKGIEIQCICPGPVDTPFMREMFGNQLNSEKRRKSIKSSTNHQTVKVGRTPEPPTPTSDPSRVSGKRCAHLITVAMANHLSEVWISNHPILLFVFVSQYAPVFAKWLGKRLGKKRLDAIKDGKNNIDGHFFKKNS